MPETVKIIDICGGTSGTVQFFRHCARCHAEMRPGTPYVDHPVYTQHCCACADILFKPHDFDKGLPLLGINPNGDYQTVAVGMDGTFLMSGEE